MRGAEEDGTFDEVAFKKFRPNLTRVLHAVGLATHVKSVSELISSRERNFGWGSVIRCSLTGWDKNKETFSGESGKVLPAFTDFEMRPILENCLKEHLEHLPDRTKIVVLLGNADDYIKKMRKAIRAIYPHLIARASYDDIAYYAGGKLWVHVGHPSPGNGYLTEFLEGDSSTGQGKKRELARQAIRDALDEGRGTI